MATNTRTKTTDYSQNAGYREHRHISNGDTLVIYNAAEFGFISTPTERWIVMYEPVSLHLMTRTLKEAQSIMRDAAQHPDEYFEPEAVALNRRHEDDECAHMHSEQVSAWQESDGTDDLHMVYEFECKTCGKRWLETW